MRFFKNKIKSIFWKYRKRTYNSHPFYIDKVPYMNIKNYQITYKVFYEKNNTSFYIGDIRKSKNGKYISYLDIEKVKIQEGNLKVRHLKKQEMHVLSDDMEVSEIINKCNTILK